MTNNDNNNGPFKEGDTPRSSSNDEDLASLLFAQVRRRYDEAIAIEESRLQGSTEASSSVWQQQQSLLQSHLSAPSDGQEELLTRHNAYQEDIRPLLPRFLDDGLTNAISPNTGNRNTEGEDYAARRQNHIAAIDTAPDTPGRERLFAILQMALHISADCMTDVDEGVDIGDNSRW